MLCIFTESRVAEISSTEGCVTRSHAAPAPLDILLPYIVVGATHTFRVLAVILKILAMLFASACDFRPHPRL